MNYLSDSFEAICADEKVRVFHHNYTRSGLRHRDGYVYVNDRGRSRRIYGRCIWLGDRWRFVHDGAAKHRHLLLAPAGAGV